MKTLLYLVWIIVVACGSEDETNPTPQFQDVVADDSTDSKAVAKEQSEDQNAESQEAEDQVSQPDSTNDTNDTNVELGNNVFKAEIVAEDCELDLVFDKSNGSFKDVVLDVDAVSSVSAYKCKVIWSPTVPENMRLVSAELKLQGKWDNTDGTADIHIGHKLLGLGDAPLLKAFEPSDGDFEIAFKVQNLNNQVCGVESKLITTVNVLVQAGTDPAKLALNKLTLSEGKFEVCP